MSQGIQKKRILLASRDENVISDVIKCVDYTRFIIDIANCRKDAVTMFVQFRHSIILADIDLMPKKPGRIIDLRYMAHKNPVIIIISPAHKLDYSYSFLRTNNASDILHLPVDSRELEVKLSNAVEFHHFSARDYFLRDISFLILVTLPLMILLILLLFE